jgi:hypothetical protein
MEMTHVESPAKLELAAGYFAVGGLRFLSSKYQLVMQNIITQE